jgi:hypothetical protein
MSMGAGCYDWFLGIMQTETVKMREANEGTNTLANHFIYVQ